MKLTARTWIEMLAQAHPPSRESVIYAAPFRKTLRIPKETWNRHFAVFGGIELQRGAEIALTPSNQDSPRVPLPDWAVECLALGPGSHVCITQRDDGFYLKKLEPTQAATPIPGCMIVDTFADQIVTRTCAHNPDLDDIQRPRLREWLSQMGSFRADPLARLQTMEGRLGLLARKAFLHGWTKTDREAARTHAGQMIAAQAPDGSWASDVLLTASNLIRLRQLEMPSTHPACARASDWLLSLPEPAGLPGLWLVSQALTERFNDWKAKPGAKGRPHRRESKGELGRFTETVDYTINYAVDACELRLTWTTALVLEALLRCGLHKAPRIVRALNTLFALSGDGGWCGCGYLDARVHVPAADATVDFNRFPVPRRNVPHGIDWFSPPTDVARADYDGHYQALQLDGRRALWAKSWHNTGLCTMVMHRALSHHPQYTGSTLETIGALRLAYVQSATGSWGNMVYQSSMLGFLGQSTHPLAAFLVLRSIPLLIRTQRSDGLWEEKPLAHHDRATPPPTKQESTFLILSALQQFDFLDGLLPQDNHRRGTRPLHAVTP